MHPWTKVVAAFAAIAITFFSAGCSFHSTKDRSHYLKVGSSAAPLSMDPTTTNAAAISEALLYNVYETLVKIDEHGQLRGLLAKSYEISEDRTRYRFVLNDATFTTGKEVTSHDVIASFERILNDPHILPVHKKKMSVVSSMEAEDNKTVLIVLNHPSNSWFYALSQPMGIIFDPSTFDDLTVHPVGSGPYRFDQWIKGASLSLERNEQYWATPVDIEGVTFKYYSDPNAENTAMLSGGLDVMTNVVIPQAIDQFDSDRFTIIDGVTNGEIVMGMNHDSEPLKDRKVRQAILYGIDKVAMRQAVWAGYGQLIGSMVPPTDPWYEDLNERYPYDPDRARRLLKEAGYDRLQLRMRVPTVPYGPSAAAYMASQLRSIGIDLIVDELEFPATWVNTVMKRSDYDLTIIAHVEPRDMPQFADPQYYWHYDNEDFQELIAQADRGNDSEQIDAYRQAARILADDAAAGFLWILPRIVVTTPQVSGIQTDAPSLSFDLTSVSMR